MRHTRIIQVLGAFTTEEMRRFALFLDSPLHNTNERLRRFFQYLLPLYPDFPHGPLSDEAVFEKVFPGESYDDQRFRLLRSSLLKKALYFLAIEKSGRDETLQQLTIIEALAEKDLDPLIPAQQEKCRKLIEGSARRDEQYYLRKYQLENQVLGFRIARQSRFEPGDLLAAVRPLDEYYLINKLKYASAITHRQQFLQEEQELFFLEEILNKLRLSTETFSPVVRIYYFGLMILRAPEEEQNFYQLKSGLIQHRELLSPDDLESLYANALNYCNQQSRAGKTYFLKEMLDLYKQMLEIGIVFRRPSGATANFKNITTLGLQIGEFSWTEEFIHSYKDQIPEDVRHGAFHYNLAHLYTYQEKYREALKHLQLIDFPDAFFRVGYNILLLKIYYEQKEREGFLALCDTFRTYIRRQRKMSEANQRAYLNFGKLLRRLFKQTRLRAYPDQQALSRIREQIEETDYLVEKLWLLGKVGEGDDG